MWGIVIGVRCRFWESVWLRVKAVSLSIAIEYLDPKGFQLLDKRIDITEPTLEG